MSDALQHLRKVGSPKDLPDGTIERQKVNSHIHLPPNFSAFTTVRQAVELAARQNIGVLGVSNYYDYEVYDDFASLAHQHNIFPLFGLEIICLVDELTKAGVKINDPGNPGKFYICGKGITKFTRMTPEAQRLLNLIRKNDSTRMATMVRKLNDLFTQRGLPLDMTESAVVDMVIHRHDCPRSRVYLQERHVCQAFQEQLFQRVPSAQRIDRLTNVFGAAPKAGSDDAVKIQNEIRSYLMKAGKPGYVEETFINFEDAYKLIVELGGIPCYPTLADGASPICTFEDPIEMLIDNIKARNIGAAEFIPVRNSPAVLSQYVKAMRKAGLIVVAGTEHNTLDLIPIEPACMKDEPIPDDVKEIFWEGACIVAAHQFLMMNGQNGFIAGCGEQRIAELKQIGQSVICRYQDRSKTSL